MPPASIPRPASGEGAPGPAAYVAAVPGDDAVAVLAAQAAEVAARFRGLDEPAALRRYAPGKWSVKEVLGHLSDAERIFAYRALRFARGDATPLPGFEEDDYVPPARFDARPVADVVDELLAVRAATLALLRGLPADAVERRGVANGHPTTVRAVAWAIAGHARHHLDVLRARYGV